MRNCTSPYDHTSNPVFLTTNIILLPVLFGIGTLGNVLNIIVFNRSYLRTANVIYVYLTGLASCDLLILIMIFPKGLRDMAAFSLDFAFSKHMALYVTLHYGFSNVLKHSLAIIMALSLAVRLVSLNNKHKRIRWTTISASRIMVFVIVLFCLIVNFPRFFEYKVTELKGHCIEGKTLWHSGNTEFGNVKLFLKVYPWIVTMIGFAIPFFLIIILNIALMVKINIWKVIRNYIKATREADGPETQINILLMVISITYLILELPSAIYNVLLSFGSRYDERYTIGYSNFYLISECMSLIHSSINFILYILISSAFRKTFRRTFCCTCLTGDDFYEPVKCKDILMCRCNANRPTGTQDRGSTESSDESSEPESEKKFEHRKAKSKPRLPPAYRGPNVSRDGWI